MIHLLIVHSDREYGFALARAISGVHKAFDVKIVSFESILNDPDFYYEKQDFLIADSGCEVTLIKRITSQLSFLGIVILTENRPERISSQVEKEESEIWQIYQYATVSEIHNDINFLYGYLTGKKIINPILSTALIGVLGVSGGVGTSAVAIGLARELSRYHDKRILYLSYEEITATELFVHFGTGTRRIGEYLYYLFERKNEKICSHLEGFTTRDEYGVSFFCPSKGRNDLRYLTKEELELFIKSLTDSNRYDYILFDLNHDLSEESRLLLSFCSRLIMVRRDDPVSIHKMKKLTAYLKKAVPDLPKKVLLHISNMAKEGSLLQSNGTGLQDYKISGLQDSDLNDLCNHGTRRSQNEDSLYIQKDESSFRLIGEHLDISINQSFGTGIKEIADAVLVADTS